MLHANLEPGLSGEQFQRDLLQALMPATSSDAVPTEPSNDAAETSAGPSQPPPPDTSMPPSAGSSNTDARVRVTLEDRRRRLENEKTAKDKAEKAKRQAIAASMREEAEAAVPNSSVSNKAKYARMHRDRERAAQTERDRVLKAIENDKVERRARAQRQREVAADTRPVEMEAATDLSPVS